MLAKPSQRSRFLCLAVLSLVALVWAVPDGTASETDPKPAGSKIHRSPPPQGAKTHTMVPGERFRAGWFKRWPDRSQ